MPWWMPYPYLVVWLVSVFAWARAIAAHRRSPLLFSIIWAALGWSVACAATFGRFEVCYIALALFGCASVAVLGARDPSSSAWQFVVCGLAGVLLLPLVESSVRDRPIDFSGVRWTFVCGLSAFAALNYLFTRLAFPTILLAVGLALTSFIPRKALTGELAGFGFFLGLVCVWSAPAVGWLGVRDRRRDQSPTDRLWLSFRDRFGAVWALRVIEQFNRSAANAGADTTLRWSGISGMDDAAAFERLNALLTRFGLSSAQKLGPEYRPPAPPPTPPG